MITSVRLLNLTWLRQRPLRTFLTVVAIAAGVTLPIAVLLARASVLDGLEEFDQQRSGPAAFEVVGGSQPGGVDEATAGRIAAVDGVEAAVPIVQAVTLAEAGGGDTTVIVALGVDCRIEVVVGGVGCPPDARRQGGEVPGFDATPVVVAPSLLASLGDGGVVRTDQGRVPVAGAPALDLLEEINGGRIAVFSLDAAQELFTRGDRFDRVLVVAEPDADEAALRRRVAAAAGEHNRVRTTVGGTSWIDPQVPLLLLVSLMALGIGGQLAHNAVALSLEERRRDLAVTGALGASRSLLIGGMLVEATLVGLAGGLLGSAGGVGVARFLVARLGETAERLTGVGVDLTIPWWVMLAGLGTGLAVTFLATIGPAWRAVRADLSADLQLRGAEEATDEPRRVLRAAVLTGLALACGVLAWLGQRDGAMEPWQPGAAQVGFLGLTVLMARAGFNAAAPLLQAVATRLPGLRRGTAGVAVDNLVGSPGRTGTLSLAAAAAVSLGVVLGSLERTLPDGVAAEAARDAPGAVQVTSLPGFLNLGIAARPGAEVRDLVGQVDGVAEVTGEYVVTLDHPASGTGLVAVLARDGAPTSAFPVYDGDTPEDVLGRGDAVIGPTLARELGLDVGDAVTVPGRDGLAAVQVGAIWANGWLGGRNISVSSERFEQLWGRHATFDLLVTPTPGTRPDELARRIETALGDRYPDVEARTVQVRADEVVSDVKEQISPFVALQRGLLVVALVATLSTLLLAAVQRRREFAVLTAVGMAPEGLGRMILVEAGLVGLVGTIVGTVAGIASGVALTFVLPVLFGYGSSWTYHVDLLAPAVYGVLATAFVLAGAALPAWRATRLDPTTALRYE